MDNSRKLKVLNENRANELFITGENWDKNRLFTIPKPFNLSTVCLCIMYRIRKKKKIKYKMKRKMKAFSLFLSNIIFKVEKIKKYFK